MADGGREASSAAAGDAVSSGAGRDAAVSAGEGARCRWCDKLLPAAWPGFYCSKRCRQSAFRLRRRREKFSIAPGGEGPARFAYADPIYPGRAKKYYGRENDPFKGEVGEMDQAAVIARLEAGQYQGWALSTAADALQDVLALCPRGARVAPWVKPRGVPPRTYGPHNAWEPIIYVGGRKRRPGVRDWLMAQPARGGGTLMGRKPIAFCAFLFDLLGMMPGDTLDDFFPGTGVVGRAWAEVSARAVAPAPGTRAVLLDVISEFPDASSEFSDASSSGVAEVHDDAAPDSCDACGLSLAPGEYGGGCVACDLLLCGGCEAVHGPAPCDGEGGPVLRAARAAIGR